jgi:hypothetical protein
VGGDLDGEDGRRHREQRQHHAPRVQPAGPVGPRLGQDERAEHQQHHHHGDVDQEDRAPVEVLQQHPADDRAHRRPGGEAGGPQRHGEPALGAVGEQGAQQGQRGGHEHRAEEAQQGAGGDEVGGVGGERGRQGHRTEAGDADQQRAAPADAVAQGAHRDQQARQDERVDVDDPQLLVRGRAERDGDRGQGEPEHGVVDRHQQGGEEQDGQAEPLAAAGAGGDDGHCTTSLCTVQTVQLPTPPAPRVFHHAPAPPARPPASALPSP